MHQTLDFSNILYADFKNATFEIPYQLFPILMRYATITMAQKKTGHRFIANNMTNFDIDIIISNVIANYEKKSFI